MKTIAVSKRSLSKVPVKIVLLSAITVVFIITTLGKEVSLVDTAMAGAPAYREGMSLNSKEVELVDMFSGVVAKTELGVVVRVFPQVKIDRSTRALSGEKFKSKAYPYHYYLIVNEDVNIEGLEPVLETKREVYIGSGYLVSSIGDPANFTEIPVKELATYMSTDDSLKKLLKEVKRL